jgi:hypothetical protein
VPRQSQRAGRLRAGQVRSVNGDCRREHRGGGQVRDTYRKLVVAAAFALGAALLGGTPARAEIYSCGEEEGQCDHYDGQFQTNNCNQVGCLYWCTTPSGGQYSGACYSTP